MAKIYAELEKFSIFTVLKPAISFAIFPTSPDTTAKVNVKIKKTFVGFKMISMSFVNNMCLITDTAINSKNIVRMQRLIEGSRKLEYIGKKRCNTPCTKELPPIHII